MNATKKFDLSNSSLEGRNLIEASAGTGKTYTITALFLRLIIEKSLCVENILVVTFTEAATEELRDRIRTKLRQAIEAFSAGKSDDEFLNTLVNKHGNVNETIKRLKDAVRDFDQAAIFTIHGFCKRILDESAFESGNLFDTELVTDQEYLKREIIQDFWRKHIYHESPLFVNYLIYKNFDPGKLLKLASNRIIQPDFKIIPEIEIPDSTDKEIEFQTAFQKLHTEWQSARDEVERLLMSNENLNRNKYRRQNIPIWIGLMNDFLASDGKNPVLFDQFNKFTLTEITDATKKNEPIPDHPFFKLCGIFKEKQERLENLFEQRILGLKVKLFNYLHDELIKTKKQKNIQSFDDLLLRLYDALQQTRGNELAEMIRKKYRAALIDEFQDTDPVQYAIFKNIFGTEQNILFLIGDPKQAIYGFRGADIFAYMDAAQHAEFRHTLSQNWRSEPGLIAAQNTIFENADSPFIYNEIPFEPVRAAEKKDREFLKINGKSDSPLQLWYLDASKIGNGDKAIPKTNAREVIYKAVAAEISNLLNLAKQKKAIIGTRPIKEEDIAVLVRRNTEALMMQQALIDLNISSVLYSTNNLFDSREAMEVQRILASIAEPNNDKLLKAALTTDILGIKGEEIDYLMEVESAWEAWLIKFRNYYEVWNRRGFVQMFRYFLSEEKVLPRLMNFPDGERRNTNVLHLSEILHQVSVERKFRITALLKWLSEQRDPRTQRLEEHQLRLESDEKAVKVVTVHKSKGLEYHVIFCPFTWDGSKIKSSIDHFVFHDEKDNMKLTLDLGSEHREQNRIYAEKELLAENLRLLYVALTRAKNRCYLIWGRINEAETSAPAYLFHQLQSPTSENSLQQTSARFKQMSDEEIYSELERIADRSNGTISLSHIRTDKREKYSPGRETKEQLIYQKFGGNIDSGWRIASYSSLVSRLSHAAEIADYDHEEVSGDAGQEIYQKTGELSGIASFPRGTKTGIFFHSIFELIDFEQKDPSSLIELLDTMFKQYGIDPHLQEDVFEMIQKVLSMPLEPDNLDFTLSKIKSQHRLHELEFYFPLKNISPNKLKALFKKYAGTEFSDQYPEQIEKLNFAPMRGFMKGFIDLVFQYDDRFFIVDWKSNFLGDKIENYEFNRLKEVMEEELYILQYHIYTVALDQYLRMRMPEYNYEKHFGGVYYIFLRGVEPELGYNYGVYRDRPSSDFINELGEELIDSSKLF